MSIAMSISSNVNHLSPIVVVGSANQDLTSYTDTLPNMGETVMGTSFETSCGGKGANQANAAASLQLAPVKMICRVGDDVFGKNLLANFRNNGVQVNEQDAVLANTSSGVATIIVDTKTGDNMIIVTPGANHSLKPTDIRNELLSMPVHPGVVLVQLEIQPESSLEALKTAKELGSTTIFNPAPASKHVHMDGFYQYTDILVPNELELKTLCGKREDDHCNEESLGKFLLKKGVQKAVIVTLGARGAMVVESPTDADTRTTTTWVNAPEDLPCRNDPVIDTVGAGDGFCGALAAYLSCGLSLPRAATLACGFAGMSVRRKGTKYPSVGELPDCLRVSMNEPRKSNLD
jgi:ribokinase